MSTRQPNSSAPRYSNDYASDRSPLQKVETIVNGMREDMSKEEKRARAQQAEERLAARRASGTAPVDRRDSRGPRYDTDYFPPTSAPQGRSMRTASTRTDYRTDPAATRAVGPSTDPPVARQAASNVYNQSAPVSDYPVVRNDSRRRSDGAAPRVLTKPPPSDARAVSDSYGQPPVRQRSVREGRVFDTDAGYDEQDYDAPGRQTGSDSRDFATRSNGNYVDTQGSPKAAQSSPGMVGRMKSIFRRKRASAPPPEPSLPPSPEPEAEFHPSEESHHHAGFHHHEDARRYQQPRYRDYRKNIRTTRVGLSDPAPVPPAAGPSNSKNEDQAWWEKSTPSSSSKRRASASASASAAAEPQPTAVDGTQEKFQPYQQPPPGQQTYFQPQLYLKCGPLLRFTGLRKSTRNPDREVWTGSVMIVTVDSKSRYEQPPNLRIFKQPIKLLPPPPHAIDEASGQQLPPEYVDPIAGQVKMSRVGKTLYVKPVEALEEKRDLSRVEDDSGLFEEFRSQPLQPPSGKGTAGGLRSVGQDGELRGKFQDISAYVLHRERGVTFWKWNLEIELSDREVRLAYRINRGPPIGFWVPARGETMNMMFYSCNGFSISVNPNEFSGPDPLWRDVLNSHQTRPFHVMLGGGDQIYMDAATVETRYFGDWSKSKNAHHKHNAPFTAEMQDELERFYLNRYSMWFSQGLFGMANSQIPMVNMWDDHDIVDGYGSYPDHTMGSPVMSGVGNVAFKYYMLFQHQSLPIEDESTDPSWLLGAEPGPYITELSRSLYMSLGRRTAFLGLDCRTERMRDEVMSQDTWDLVFSRLRKEIVKGETQHLIVLLGIPIAYPRLNFLENVLTSRIMDPVKAIGRTGALGGFVNKFDGGVEILDDLDDHWTAKHHKGERNWFIQELQELAADMSVRITILSGDVHLGAVGQFFSNKALGLPKDQDHRYMPNVISSAIVNTPPADFVADALNKRNKIHHLDEDTDENMMPMFPEDVNNKSRNNKHLLPRRNWCSIREYKPELTPPPTPSPPATPSGSYQEPQLTRSFSFGRRSSLPGAGLIRRLSQRGQRSNPPVSYPQRMNDPEYFDRRRSTDVPRRASADMSRAGPTQTVSEGELTRDPNARPSPFLRRPTVMLPHNPTHMINLRGGLDIRLNCENDRGDPAGTTTEYRLIVPALDYRGPGDPNPEAVKPQGKLKKWFGGGANRGKNQNYSEESFAAGPGQHNRPYDSYDSLQQEPAPVPVSVPVAAPAPAPALVSQRRRDSLDPPQNVVLGPNGLPIKPKKNRPVANTGAPLPSASAALPTKHQQPLPAASVSMRRQDLPQQQRSDQRTQAPVRSKPETYAGPNTVIPATLPGPPSGPPPTQRSVSDTRYAQRAVLQQDVADKRRMSADVKRGANPGYV